MTEGYGIVGYPGAGKSTAGEILAEHLDAIHIETGDIVRRGASEFFGSDIQAAKITSDELGDYSTMRREEDGGDYVAQDAISNLESDDNFPESPVVVTGMRDTMVPDLFDEFFDEFTIVWIHTDFSERLERLQERGRQDEGEFTKEDLARRDGRESMWGTSDLIARADQKIFNDGTLEELEKEMERTVRISNRDRLTLPHAGTWPDSFEQ